MIATILGCGEAFDERLPNTSILLECGRMLLLDCGYSAPPQVWKAVADPGAIDAIWISHAHADHYFGMPALLGRMWEDGRTKPLTIFSHAPVLDQLPVALDLGYKGLPTRYQYEVHYCAVQEGRPVEFGGATLNFAHSTHSAPNYALRVEAGGKAFCYSGDGMFTEAGRTLFSGADLVVHEAYAFEKLPIHADIPSLVELRERERIGRLAFVHVQRALRRSPERIMELVAKSAAALSLPEPGDRIHV